MGDAQRFIAQGIMKQKFQPQTKPKKNGTGNFTKTDFVLLFADNTEATFSSFDPVSNDLMRGQVLQFEYEQNGKYNTVRGKISEVGGPVAAPTPQTTAPAPAQVPATAAPASAAPAKRTYTRKAPAVPSTTTAPVAQTPAPEVAKDPVPQIENGSGREDCRDEAEDSVKINLISAKKIATEVGYASAPLADIVALADMVGRTQTAIFMDSKKDARMTRFKR